MKKNEISKLKKVAKSRTIVAIDGTGLVKDGYITSTNLEHTVSIKTSIRGEGLIALSDIEIPFDDAWIEGSTLFVVRKGTVVRTATHNANDFPKINQPNTQSYYFDQAETLKKVMLFCGKDEARPAMMGVFLDKTNIVATDAHRLMWEKLNNTSIPEVIIPASGVQLLSDVNYEMSFIEDVDVYTKEKVLTTVFFTSENEIISSRLIEGRFPNYKSVIPQYTMQQHFTKDEVLPFIEIASSISTNNIVGLLFKSGKISIAGQDNDTNKNYLAEVNDQDKLHHEQFEIYFNGKYLMHALKNIKTQNIEMSFSASNRAVVFNGKILLMPSIVKTSFFEAIPHPEKVVENVSESVSEPVEEAEVVDVIEEAEAVEEFPSFGEDAPEDAPEVAPEETPETSETPITDHPSPITDHEETNEETVFLHLNFTPKSFVVYGSTEGIADKLSKHGRFTRNMRIDENTKVDGYWFSNKRLSEVIEIINNAS